MPRRAISLLGVGISFLIGTQVHGQESVVDFYRGKQITLYIGYAPGGGYDEYGRLASRYLGRHIPGSPRVVVQYRPGAGSAILANELFNKMPRDGAVLGMFANSLPVWELLGQDNLRFKSNEFGWVGRMTDADDVMVARPNAGAVTLQQALERSITVGVPGSTSSPALTLGAANELLGAKFKVVTGYTGSAEIRLAVERGELDGLQGLLWSVDRKWVEANQYRVLYRVSSLPLPGLDSVPALVDLAKTEEQRHLIKFFTSFTEIGRALTTPPGLPKERLTALRDAFDQMMSDAELQAEVTQNGIRLRALSGTELQELVSSLRSLPPDTMSKAKSVAKLMANE